MANGLSLPPLPKKASLIGLPPLPKKARRIKPDIQSVLTPEGAVMQTETQGLFVPETEGITVTAERLPATPESEALRKRAEFQRGQQRAQEILAAQAPTVKELSPELEARRRGLRQFADIAQETVGGALAAPRGITFGVERALGAVSRARTPGKLKTKEDRYRAASDVLL